MQYLFILRQTGINVKRKNREFPRKSFFVEPFVQAEKIVNPANQPVSPAQTPTEKMLLPDQPLLFREIFFKDFYIEAQDIQPRR